MPSALKTIKLSVQEFATPCPRTGHIDNTDVAATTEQGIILHQQIQASRAKKYAQYRAEVRTRSAFERGGYRFEIEGRMDGIFEDDTPRIEEIKSTFDLTGLADKIQQQGLGHGYVLQLMTYGYFYLQENQVIPDLSFHLVSVRNRKSQNVHLKWDGLAYEDWLELRLVELVAEAKRAEARAARRKKVAKALEFPFPTPRRGQRELIATIEDGLRADKNLLLQAPTGLGKTVGVLYPVLRSALARGQSVFYATPKNSQHTVAEEALDGFRDNGANVKSLTLTAKTKLCLKDEVFCRPEYCEFARNYHDKVRDSNLKDVLRAKRKHTTRSFKKIGLEHQVCPYALQWEIAEEADVLIGDYNHVFGPRSALSNVQPMSCGSVGKPELVIDEAHNLPSRSMDHYSPALPAYQLEKLRPALEGLPPPLSTDALTGLDAVLALIHQHRQTGNEKPHMVSLDPQAFASVDGQIRTLLNRYLETDIEILPHDPVMDLANFVANFSEILSDIVDEERTEFFSTYQPERGGSLKITCCDASRMLRPQFKAFEHTVAFSATLKPFDYYARLMGMAGDDLLTAEFASPFDHEKRKLMIIPQISTKYATRRQFYGKICETISRVSALRSGNYVAFFPSFAFMEDVHRQFVAPPKFRVCKQERGASNFKVQETLDGLRSAETPTILFAVQGGVFSEGVDYPGAMLIGAFVVGPPLPNFDIEREGMKDYYQEQYEDGFNYAYAYPAMAKAVQAAGRVIRREEDRGLIILMDERFLDKTYSASMPSDWFTENARELVSESILKDVAHFWDGTQASR